MKKIDPVTPEFVKEGRALAAKAGAFEDQIVNRIGYIMECIFELFDKKNAYWYFRGADEGEVGDLWAHYQEHCSSSIDLIVDNCPGPEMVLILETGEDWGFSDSIPSRWLFEDFEQELINGKKKFEDRKIERKAKKKATTAALKKEDQELIEEAKKKLSEKELAALKRSL